MAINPTTEMQLFASANMPDTDSGAAGGAIDLLRRMDFTQMAANDTIEALSDGADTRNITVEARKADGSIVSETKALTGATAITFSTLGTVERILKVEAASADGSRTVTVRRATGAVLIRTIPAGERGYMMLFRKCASDPTVQVDYYEKGFWKNTNSTLALLGATVEEAADPDARVDHLLAASKDDSATSTNRLTAPAVGDTQDPDTFDGTAKAVPGTDLGSGQAIGCWYRLRLPAGDAPHRTTYSPRLAGQSV